VVVKGRRVRKVGHVARMREMRYSCNIFIENVKGKYQSEELDAVARIILKSILRK
jgi:hypothetical protein